jgi:DNA-binding PadR family transcriptional regulator
LLDCTQLPRDQFTPTPLIPHVLSFRALSLPKGKESAFRFAFTNSIDKQLVYYYIVVHMNPERTLGEFEQIVLLAVLRLGDEAYGVTILDEIAARTGRNPAPGALYTTLHRMEDKGLVTFRDGSPTPERGGRAKRFVVVTQPGRAALVSAQTAYRSLLKGLDLLPTARQGEAYV